MEELVTAENVRTGHYIRNPLPMQGEGSWAKVTHVSKEDGHIVIKAGRWGVRRSPKEGVTVLFDLEREP